jgi:sugar/nucleoside kinase (ribokinase family)
VPQPSLLVIGDVAWDVLVRPRTDLVWGSDVFGTVELMPGGSAANVAVWARRLGAAVRLAGKVGGDTLGELMSRHLEAEGVAGGLIAVQGAATTRIGALVGHRGEHAFVIDHTRLLPFGPADVPASLVDGVDAVFLNGYGVFTSGSPAFAAPALAEARRRGVPIAFDPSSFALIAGYGPARLLDELGRIDILLANEEEARALSDTGPVAGLQARAALVVVKRGADGSSVFGSLGEHSAAAVPVDAVDTTGAGDAFDAAFLVELLRTGDLEAALRAGNRLGAHVAASLGAQPAAPVWMDAGR